MSTMVPNSDHLIAKIFNIQSSYRIACMYNGQAIDWSVVCSGSLPGAGCWDQSN